MRKNPRISESTNREAARESSDARPGLSAPTPRPISNGWVLIGPGLLAAAHLTAAFAVNSFGLRTGGSPFHREGLVTYSITAVAAFVGWVVLFRNPGSASEDKTASLLLFTLPPLASVLFWAGLGGPYSPYDPFDSDLFRLYFLPSAVLVSLVATLYGSLSYLGVSGLMLATVYVGAFSLPNLQRHPGVEWFGPRPEIFTSMVSILLQGAVLVLVRNALFGRRGPGLLPGAILTTLLGAGFLYRLSVWLPQNGDCLLFRSADTCVPEGAWDWTRQAGQSLTAFSAVAVTLSAILALVGSVRKYL